MVIFYLIGIYSYLFFIRFASLFNTKAKKWLNGRKNIFETISSKLKQDEERIWFHFASLGEFEQGRTVLESYRKAYPNFKIVITFFSPSGYEIRKNYEGADYVFYLPIDNRKNAIRLLDLINPKQIFFTKYEYWHFYFEEIKKRKIPLYIISSIFRKNQLFFKQWAFFYRAILNNVTYFFLQDNESANLLESIKLNNYQITGDTRFDRVYENSKVVKSNVLIEKFKENGLIFLAGSTWPKDELILKEIDFKKNNFKLIIAPHEITQPHIQFIENNFNGKSIRISQANENNISEYKILIIDNIGTLSSLYQYCDLAYIGGGFGSGIHNCLEAATFGKPIIFGPKYKKFKEAIDLIKLNAAFSITDYHSLNKTIDKLITDKKFYSSASLNATNYILEQKGATEKIMSFLMKKEK